MILIILLYALCAMSFTLAKTALSVSSPFFFVGVRMLCAGPALLVFSRFYSGKKLHIKPIDWLLLIQVMIFGVFIAYNFDLWSLQFLTSIESALIFSLSPFFAALISYMWFGEIMTPKKWIGLVLGALSLLPLIFSHGFSVKTGSVVPVLVLLISVLSSSYAWIVMRDLIKVRNFSPLEVNGITMFIGGIASLVLSFSTEQWYPMPVSSWYTFLLATGAIIVVCNFFFSNLYGYLLGHYTATLLSFAGFLCPLFATGLGWFFLGEEPSWGFFFAFIGVTLGLYIFYKEELRQGYVE